MSSSGMDDEVGARNTVLNLSGESLSSRVEFDELYNTLRKTASYYLSREKPGQTLQTTALVHEAFLKIAGEFLPTSWVDRHHAVKALGRAMRQILIDRARGKLTTKRGKEFHRVPWDLVQAVARWPDERIVELHDAIEKLRQTNPMHGELVDLKVFVGLTNEEAADVLKISVSKLSREWTFVRAFLYSELQDGSDQ